MQGLVTDRAGKLEVAGSQAVQKLRLAAELETFYRQLFLPLVRRATWRHGLSKEDARDVVQDAFLLAVVKLKTGGNAPVWLARVVDQLSANLRRKGARRARLEARWLRPTSLADPAKPDEPWREPE